MVRSLEEIQADKKALAEEEKEVIRTMTYNVGTIEWE